MDVDVTADQAEQPVIVPASAGRPWPILIGGTILTLIPAGFAWWMWQLSGWLAEVAFAVAVFFAVVWVAGTIVAYVVAEDLVGAEDRTVPRRTVPGSGSYGVAAGKSAMGQ